MPPRSGGAIYARVPPETLAAFRAAARPLGVGRILAALLSLYARDARLRARIIREILAAAR